MISSKISRRYAKALFGLGQEDGKYLEYGKNLSDFAQFCSSNNEFFQVVSNRIFPVEEREKILEMVLQRSDYPEIIKSFLRLLVEKNRIGAVAQIEEYYSRLTDESLNITRAEVATAKPLSKEAMDKLEKTLSGVVSKDVKMDVKEDRTLIGGLVVKIGDLVLDGSVKAQLEGLKESLKRGGYN